MSPPASTYSRWLVYRREPALYRVFDNLCSMRIEDGASQREDCISTLLACRSECRSQYPWNLVRLGIEASLRTPLRRARSLLTFVRNSG